MKFWSFSVGAVPLFTAVLLAQGPNTSSGQQSWTGLLVAAGCQTGGSAMAKSTASETLPRTTPSATTREQNRTYEQTQNQADRTAPTRKTPTGQSATEHLNATDQVTTPPVDSVNTRGSAPLDGSTGPGADETTVAKNMDNSCRIGAQTTAFSLRLSDGRLVRFDEASNARIAQQLQSGDRLKHKTKIFRAKVKGSMQGDTISIDNLKI